MYKQILVSGVVQGVGFRFFTQKVASALKLTGYVKNLLDGRVEIVVKVDDNFSQFLEKVKQGPTFSQVDKIEIKDLTTEEVKQLGIREGVFEIRRS